MPSTRQGPHESIDEVAIYVLRHSGDHDRVTLGRRKGIPVGAASPMSCCLGAYFVSCFRESDAYFFFTLCVTIINTTTMYVHHRQIAKDIEGTAAKLERLTQSKEMNR